MTEAEEAYFESVLEQHHQHIGTKVVLTSTEWLLQRKLANRDVGNLIEVECHAPLRAIEAARA